MRNLAATIKSYAILIPALLASTTSGVGKQVTPGELVDAVAVVQVGAPTGAPDSYTCIVTIEESATLNGTYTTNTTFETNTTSGQTAHKQITVNPAKPFVRATATLAFVNGTTPKIPVGVSLLVRQNVASDSNLTALS